MRKEKTELMLDRRPERLYISCSSIREIFTRMFANVHQSLTDRFTGVYFYFYFYAPVRSGADGRQTTQR
jgi:hypothetical protein